LNKILLTAATFALALVASPPEAWSKGKGGSRPTYSSGKHSSSHGGTYAGGSGSAHKGGDYKNARSGDRYGRHKN
jgi:hypothetical protein